MTSSTFTTTRRWLRSEEPEWIVWLTVAALLVAGLILRAAVTSRTVSYNRAGLSLAYPASWVILSNTEPSDVLRVGEAFSEAGTATGLSVRRLPAAEIGFGAQTVGDLALMWSMRQSQQLPSYSVLRVEPMRVAGQDAAAVDYAYVVQPSGAGIPTVARGQDVVLRQGDQVVIVTFSANADAFEDQARTWSRILSTLKLQ